MARRRIVLTESDMRNLRELCREWCADEQDERCFEELERELDCAVVKDAQEIGPDVATMHSRVRVFDMRMGRFFEYTLVYPHEARLTIGRISVLAPIGSALLGAHEGDVVTCRVPIGWREMRVVEVVQRPFPDSSTGGPWRMRPRRSRIVGRESAGRYEVRHGRGSAPRRAGFLQEAG